MGISTDSTVTIATTSEMFNKGLIITMGMLPIVVVLVQLASVAGLKQPSRAKFVGADKDKNGCVDWNEFKNYVPNWTQMQMINAEVIFTELKENKEDCDCECVTWKKVEEYPGWTTA